TFVDVGMFIGTIGFFFVLFLLYSRTFPVIAQAEVKSILKSSGQHYKELREAGKPLYVMPSGRGTVKGSATTGSEEQVSSLLETLGTFDAEHDTADDLKRIKGIGPQMEEALNQIGIHTFAQVGRMTEREYDLLDSITGSFPGRAQRDDWAGQARKLNDKK